MAKKREKVTRAEFDKRFQEMRERHGDDIMQWGRFAREELAAMKILVDASEYKQGSLFDLSPSGKTGVSGGASK